MNGHELAPLPPTLTRHGVAKYLRVSIRRVRDMEKDDQLRPTIRADGVHVFTRAQVEALAAKRARAVPAVPSSVASSKPARARVMVEGEAAARVFEQCELGVHPVSIVTKERMHPDVVRELVRDWADMRGGLVLTPETIERLEACGLRREDLARGVVSIPAVDPSHECVKCHDATARFCGGCSNAARAAAR